MPRRGPPPGSRPHGIVERAASMTTVSATARPACIQKAPRSALSGAFPLHARSVPAIARMKNNPSLVRRASPHRRAAIQPRWPRASAFQARPPSNCQNLVELQSLDARRRRIPSVHRSTLVRAFSGKRQTSRATAGRPYTERDAGGRRGRTGDLRSPFRCQLARSPLALRGANVSSQLRRYSSEATCAGPSVSRMGGSAGWITSTSNSIGSSARRRIRTSS